MNIFFIYSFSDVARIDGIEKKYFSAYKDKFNILRLVNNFRVMNWKPHAYELIKSSDVVIFFVGKTSGESENIKFEIQQAKDLRKTIYAVKLYSDVVIPNMEYMLQVIETMELHRLVEGLLSLDAVILKSKLFNRQGRDSDTLFDQYKIMIESSQKLEERRQKVNTFFLSFNGILLSLLGASIGKNAVIIIAVPVFCILGMIFSWVWKALIRSYGQLNRGKFAVINSLEERLSVSIFSAEWYALGSGMNKNCYESFTELEKEIPSALLIIYSVALIIYLISYFKEGWCLF